LPIGHMAIHGKETGSQRRNSRLEDFKRRLQPQVFFAFYDVANASHHFHLSLHAFFSHLLAFTKLKRMNSVWIASSSSGWQGLNSL